MLPLKVLCTMPPPALTSRENLPPVTASSTLPDPVTAVSCPRASVVGDRPVTLPCSAPQSFQFSFRVPPCTNSCATRSGMTSSVAGSVLMPMQRRSSPLVPAPLMVIAARARDAGSAPAILILVPTDTLPAATGQLRPSHVMEPAPTGRLKVEASQMLPLKVLCTMPPPALTSRENLPPVTASSTLPDPVTAVSCPRASVVGDRPVTFPCLAPQSFQFSFRVPPCTNSCSTGAATSSSAAGSVLMPMQRRSSPLVPAPLMVIAARARDAGRAPAILILVPTDTLPAATG